MGDRAGMITPTPAVLNLDNYANSMRSWNASERTVDVRVHLAARAAQEWPDLAVVSSDDVAAFLASPAYSDWTRATYFSALRAMFRWLLETGQIDVDPTATMRRPAGGKSRPRPLTVAEARAAQLAADDDEGALLALGMLAGLRAHEAAKIHSRDVNEDTLFVRGKGGREDLLPTHPRLWEIAQQRRGYWFPGIAAEHVSSNMVSVRISRLFTSVGIAGSFHRCRHFYGTQLLRSGVNIRVVQVLMRHSSLATTAAYLGVDEDETRTAIAGLAV